MKKVRCAIYTRKSSEEGLEQDFNSLDAQREACTAYVLSQASEGWHLLPRQYDDGGLSGGTLERPALQRLLADVAAGSIDIIVVYKVDRLTRSLLDFARLVEAFDKADTSFVSVTQSFNTTTSMGRLTLNMLLSFAQFEREVTAERIRDKIAASKAKGMWMGGTPPLGYEPNGRSLAIVEEHAATVRDIYARYLALGNVRLVCEQLRHGGIRTPLRAATTGRAFGGCAFSRGQVYRILNNPIYVGDIAHQGKLYPGQHPAVITREDWDKVQALLAGHVRGERKARTPACSLLAGIIVDGDGAPLVATHATRKTVRYRYYVSRSLQHDPQPGSTGMRIPAREIETAVTQAIARALADPLALLDKARITPGIDQIRDIGARSQQAARLVDKQDRQLVRGLLAQVQVLPHEVGIVLSVCGVADALGVDSHPGTMPTIPLAVPMRLTRTGRGVRLVQANGRAPTGGTPDPALVNLLQRARGWWQRLADGDIDIATLSRQENVSDSYISRAVRLNFLAPRLVEAILGGTQPARLTAKTLLATDLPCDWDRQLALLADA